MTSIFCQNEYGKTARFPIIQQSPTDLVVRLNKDGSDTITLKPEADKKAILAEIVIFGDQLIKNRHAL